MGLKLFGDVDHGGQLIENVAEKNNFITPKLQGTEEETAAETPASVLGKSMLWRKYSELNHFHLSK